eukprot:GHVH01008801.1.p1 GENE.GHVH01008801.1~~GHVH01008801.1.p1  ORF type:complete len:553 (+),score=76.62 GHVH01008801.1:168-1826(+)
MTNANFTLTSAHATLTASANSGTPHIRDLLADTKRCDDLIITHEKITADFSRHQLEKADLDALVKLSEECAVTSKINSMFNGSRINGTEDRAVLHVATRASRDAVIKVDGRNVVPDVYEVLDRIDAFANKIRSGQSLGATGEKLRDILVVGIGGSALGTEFVYEALKTHHESATAAKGMRMKILANVDPIDIKRALSEFDPKTTLAIICSKTFTTAETLMNAEAVKSWLVAGVGVEGLSNHLAAVSTALDLTSKFGIHPDNVFGFWDWVGGRFSVCSAVGQVPLTIMYGPTVMAKFREGARSVDNHVRSAPARQNLPMMMGLIAFWNVVYKRFNACAVLPYCQALHRFPAHIQQMCMESNGKQCMVDGTSITHPTGEIFFGEPGTNGQHSFYQLMHQGATVPADFIGFAKSQNPQHSILSSVNNHDELMCNFFAQPDALALGKDSSQLVKENCPEDLIPHKTFSGNRPSTMLLMPECDAYHVGALLSIYEHRTAVQGFLWNLNSFDQWGVQLGKVLAGTVRDYIHSKKTGDDKKSPNFKYSTQKMLNTYLTM